MQTPVYQSQPIQQTQTLIPQQTSPNLSQTLQPIQVNPIVNQSNQNWINDNGYKCNFYLSIY